MPNLPENPRERHFVQALYHLTKTLDPTRPVIGNDGWESVATDIIGIHDYDEDPDRLIRRYQADEALPRLDMRRVLQLAEKVAPRGGEGAVQLALDTAAGLAHGGARPVVALYSTFLQRAYDNVIHDVAIQRLPEIDYCDAHGIPVMLPDPRAFRTVSPAPATR